MSKILVTGVAGFIGSNLTDRLLKDGCVVVGIDNFNDYYDPKIKENNLQEANKNLNFILYREDVLNFDAIKNIFLKEKPKKVVHLAARAGVRPSIANPLLYAKVNVEGTVNLLKASVDTGVTQFIFGSSSSVYGNSPRIPFSEDDPCDHIISPYAASKRAAEFFVESFHNTFGLNATVLRFFTVYGPRGRPDMAPAIFTKAIFAGESIFQFGDGSSSRDYTYVDDVVNAISKTLTKIFDFEIINIGGNNPISLKEFIEIIERVTGNKANIIKKPTQAGDVKRTCANIDKAQNILGWTPGTQIDIGLEKYLKWMTKNS